MQVPWVVGVLAVWDVFRVPGAGPGFPGCTLLGPVGQDRVEVAHTPVEQRRVKRGGL